LASNGDPLVRNASLNSLRLLKEPRAVPLAVVALTDRQTEQSALKALRDLGGPEHSGVVADLAKRNPSLDVLAAAVQILTTWRVHPATTTLQREELDRAVAEIHGSSGSLLRWNVSGPHQTSSDGLAIQKESTDSHTQFATGSECRVVISTHGAANGSWYLAQTDVAVSEPTDVEFLAFSSCSLRIWLNGKSIHSREKPGDSSIDSDRVFATIPEANNRLTVSMHVAATESPVEFHLRFRRKSAIAERERLAQAALAREGNPERGRDIFSNVEKSLCLKCHRLNDQGERVGPELTGLGSRFSRIHIVESILEPNRTIAPSFDTLTVKLDTGHVLSALKIAENEMTITLADNQGQKLVVVKDTIEVQEASSISTMPEGLEKRMTAEEFVDLVAFLATLKEN
jgi:putative heme-binding domain-containing protein